MQQAHGESAWQQRDWKQAEALCKSTQKSSHSKPEQLALPEVDVILLMCIKAG